MDSGVRTVKDATPQVLEAIRRLASTRVMVGIPAENAFREPEPGEAGPTPTNCEIGYINEFGEPALHIPPRPFLIPTMEALKPEIISQLHKVADIAFSEQPNRATRVRKAMMALGKHCADAVQMKITEGPFKPLASYTIWMRQHRKPPRMGTKPLLDRGDLRRAVTFAIRKIGNSK